jgi:hypothetical protein
MPDEPSLSSGVNVGPQSPNPSVVGSGSSVTLSGNGGFIDQRAITGDVHSFESIPTVTSAPIGANGFDSRMRLISVTDAVNGHSAGFQARQHHDSGAGTIPFWYGFFSSPVIDSGLTTEIDHIYIADVTGAGTSPVIQYAMKTEVLDRASSFNVYLACNGSTTGSVQDTQMSWHHPTIAFGKNINSATTTQVEITALAGTVNGRRALDCLGTMTHSSGSVSICRVGTTINQSGSGGYVAFHADMTHTGTGSGTKHLFRGSVGGTDVFSVDSTGALVTGATTVAASAQLEIVSTTKGLLLPRMTTTQKNAISSPAEGLVVYDTTLHKMCIRAAAAWETVTSV